MKFRKVDLFEAGPVLFSIDNKAFTREFDIPSKDVEEQVSYLKDCDVYVVYDGDDPIGFFAYQIDGDDRVELKTMAVVPEHQHRGIGKKMTRKFLDLVKGKTVYTVTHPKNTVAIILYLKFGFSIIGWKDDYYGDGEPRILLRLDKP